MQNPERNRHRDSELERADEIDERERKRGQGERETDRERERETDRERERETDRERERERERGDIRVPSITTVTVDGQTVFLHKMSHHLHLTLEKRKKTE